MIRRRWDGSTRHQVILINALSAKMGGIRIFLMGLLARISTQHGNGQYIVLVPNATAMQLRNLDSAIEVIGFRYVAEYKILRFVWDQCILPLWAWWRGVDVMISAAGFGPWFSLCFHVVWVRNAMHFSSEYEQLIARDLGRRVILRLQRLHLWCTLQFADRVVVQQRVMAERMKQYVNIRTEKFLIMPNVCPEIPPGDSGLRGPGIRERFPQRFVINAVTFYNRVKNLEVLVEATHLLVTRGHRDLLVLLSVTHDFDAPHGSRLLERIGKLGLQEVMLNLGRVTLGGVFQSLRESNICVVPSVCESFSASYLMAMKMGVPLIAADVEWAEGVCGDAAVYFRSADATDLARTILRMKADAGLRGEMASRGVRHVRQYSWERTLDAFFASLSRDAGGTTQGVQMGCQ